MWYRNTVLCLTNHTVDASVYPILDWCHCGAAMIEIPLLYVLTVAMSVWASLGLWIACYCLLVDILMPTKRIYLALLTIPASVPVSLFWLHVFEIIKFV